MAAARAHSALIPEIAREYVLRADFDLLEEDGCSWVSSRFMRGPRRPEAGEVVYLLDAKGSGCVGTVVRVEGWYLCVRPDWSTWTGGQPPSGQKSRRSATRIARRCVKGSAPSCTSGRMPVGGPPSSSASRAPRTACAASSGGSA